MTVQLDQIDREAAERARLKAARAATLSYSGSLLASEVRTALRKRTLRLSQSEADALAQTIATAALARPEAFTLTRDERSGSLILRDRAERIARFQSAADSLSRDSRGWMDCTDGWRPRPKGERTAAGGRKSAPKAVLAASVAEQAERFRAAEREQAARPSITSTDALSQWYANGEASVDWMSAAKHREREQATGEPVPAASLAPASRAVLRAMAERLPVATDDARTALMALAGEPLRDVATLERVSIATAKRRSARGVPALEALTPRAIREAFREAAESIATGPEAPHSGPLLSGAETTALATVSAAQVEAKRLARIYGAGHRGDNRSRLAAIQPWNGPRSYVLGTGSPAAVLAYADRLAAAIAREPYRPAPGLVPTEREPLRWNVHPRAAYVPWPVVAWRASERYMSREPTTGLPAPVLAPVLPLIPARPTERRFSPLLQAMARPALTRLAAVLDASVSLPLTERALAALEAAESGDTAG